MIHAYAAHKTGEKLQPFEYDPGELGSDEVEIDVNYCGICHSDLSILENQWGVSEYPVVPGHEVVGTVAAIGSQVKTLGVGQTVGLGWFSGSCMYCEWCLSGDHNLCQTAEQTIVGRFGGFADKVRAKAGWVVPLPDGMDAAKAGPLFCGGITVFNPILQLNLKPTDHVGVIGIGGLGHMALQFLQAWGCEVTAFSSSPSKEEEARELGARHFINSRDQKALESVANSLDAVISTVNVDLNWDAYIAALRPKGRLHLVGAIPSPISSSIFPLLMGQKSISSSPVGSPSTIARMLDFAMLHNIQPVTEFFSFDQVNEALDKLKHGNPRYRLVLKR